jgi:hypothetical protein
MAYEVGFMASGEGDTFAGASAMRLSKPTGTVKAHHARLPKATNLDEAF